MDLSKRIAKKEAQLSKQKAWLKDEYISLSETPKDTPVWTELKLSIGRREEDIKCLEDEIRVLNDARSEWEDDYDEEMEKLLAELQESLSGPPSESWTIVEYVNENGETDYKEVRDYKRGGL